MTHSSLVGRLSELAQIEHRMAGVARSEGHLVFIGGEPGIGKSHFLREACTRARSRGLAVFTGKAYELPGSPPYVPFTEVLRAEVTRSPREATNLPGASLLTGLLPELAAELREGKPPANLGPDGTRNQLFEAVSDFIVAVSNREPVGLVLALDDLQWSDTTTVLLLQHLARRTAGHPVLVLAAYRTTDLAPDHSLLAAVADLSRDGLCQRLELSALAETDAATLVGRLTADTASTELTARLSDQAEGIPFFIVEMVRDLQERGTDLSELTPGFPSIPESIRYVMERRLGRLSPAANAMLQTAAVIGETVPFGLLAAASTLPSDALIDAAEEAERAGMLRETADGYSFGHGLIQRAVYDALSLARRWHLHQRVAEGLEASPASGPHANLAVIGHHWRLSGRPERATEHFLRSGDEAVALTAWVEAAKDWEFALECMEAAGDPLRRRARLLEGLGDLYFLSTFEAEPSVDRYLRAADLYEGMGDAVDCARARSRAGRSLAYPTSGFDYEKALEHLHAAEKVLRNEPPSVELGELYCALAHAESHALLHGPEDMLGLMRLARNTADRLNDDFLRDFLRIQSLHLQGHYLGLQGRLSEGLTLEASASGAAVAIKDKAGPVGQWPGRWEELLVARSRGLEPADLNQVGSPHLAKIHSRVGLANFTTNCTGWQNLDLYDPIAARRSHELIRDGQGRFITPFLFSGLFLCGAITELRKLAEAGPQLISTNNPDAVGQARAMVALADGRWAEFQSSLDERAERWRRAGSRSLTVAMDRSLLRAARASGDTSLARSLAEDGLAIALRSGAVKYEFIFRAEVALLDAEGGDFAGAEANLVRCREVLDEGEDWRGVSGRLALAEAAAAGLIGDVRQAEAHFQQAVTLFRKMTLPWDEAEAFELWAASCRRFHRSVGRQTFLAEKFAAARSIYERIGAGQPWFERLQGEAARLAPVHARPLERRADGLTAREIEVLGLLAAGRSSREIASELVLSIRTVERHAANIYLKTGTHGRAQIATYALEHGLAATRDK